MAIDLDWGGESSKAKIEHMIETVLDMLGGCKYQNIHHPLIEIQTHILINWIAANPADIEDVAEYIEQYLLQNLNCQLDEGCVDLVSYIIHAPISLLVSLQRSIVSWQTTSPRSNLSVREATSL